MTLMSSYGHVSGLSQGLTLKVVGWSHAGQKRLHKDKATAQDATHLVEPHSAQVGSR